MRNKLSQKSIWTSEVSYLHWKQNFRKKNRRIRKSFISNIFAKENVIKLSLKLTNRILNHKITIQ